MPQSNMSPAERERVIPKFLGKGTQATVIGKSVQNPVVDPKVDGRFGPRKMYIIETLEYGKVYVSPAQLMKLDWAIKTDYNADYAWTF